VPHPEIDQAGHVVDRTGLELPSDKDLDADARGVQPEGVLHIHSDLLVRKLPEDARAAAGTQDHRFLALGRDKGAQDPARAEERIAIGDEGNDGQVDALEAGGRPWK
jgi:hypothetical protein